MSLRPGPTVGRAPVCGMNPEGVCIRRTGRRRTLSRAVIDSVRAARARSWGSTQCSPTIRTDVRKTPGAAPSRTTACRPPPCTERTGAPGKTFPPPAASTPSLDAPVRTLRRRPTARRPDPFPAAPLSGLRIAPCPGWPDRAVMCDHLPLLCGNSPGRRARGRIDRSARGDSRAKVAPERFAHAAPMRARGRHSGPVDATAGV